MCMLVNSNIFFVWLLVETRTFSMNFRIFCTPEISKWGLAIFSIKKLKLTRETDPQQKQGLTNVSGSLWSSMQTLSRLVTQSSFPHECDEKSAWRDQTASAKEASVGNLVTVLMWRNFHASREDLQCSFLLHLKQNRDQHQLGVSVVLTESGMMIVYSLSLCRATGSHSSVLQAWPTVQVLTKTSRTDWVWDRICGELCQTRV